ncbi:phage tail length tape measure family protein [Sphingobium yanoikuyae]|uniref:phage tail length tape measure family protein n=1 Tax=Sphingobium yanoikuyae TaxID=13690 RepID=UPI00345E703C
MTEADKVVVEIEARVDQANRALTQHANTADKAMTAVERSAAKAEAAIRSSAIVAVDNTARVANAQRNLGRQWADIGAQAASGQSIFMVLAQQAPQVADALTDMGGRAGRVAAFFSGPWGAALLAAGSVIGVVASKALEGGDSIESLTKKLEANAEKARATAQAQAIFETSLYGAADASAKLNKELKEQNQTQLQLARSTLALAEARRQDNLQNLRAEVTKAAAARRAAQAAADPSNFVQGGTVMGASGFGQTLSRNQATSDLVKATERERVALQGLKDATAAVVEARVPLLDMKAVAASDESAAATLRHEEALGKLRDEFRKTGNESAYLAGRTKIENELEAAQEAIHKRESDARKAGTEAKRAAAKAAREAAKAAREELQALKELQATLERVVDKYDPLRSIAMDTAKAIQDIDKLRLAGLITAVDAVAYKLKLANDQAKAIADAAWKAQEQRWLGVGITQEDMDGSGVRKDIDRRVEMEREANERIAADFRQKQEAQIRTLANIFEDGFRGGTKAIWGDFKAIGMRILAEMIARWVTMKSSGQGSSGDIGSLLATAAQSVLGYASGGYTGNGGRNQVAGVVHKGEYVFDAGATNRIGVGNLAAMRNGALPRSMAGAGGFAIQQTVHVDARNSVNPTGFERRLLSLSGQQAVEAASAMGRAVYKGVPSRLAEYGRDGT